ncbi:MAG: hypothetical protein JWM28_3597 [Chitinophagaceae bacterium]|nr:hypothetical protein [Chitinophagaceae bacterium]
MYDVSLFIAALHPKNRNCPGKPGQLYSISFIGMRLLITIVIECLLGCTIGKPVIPHIAAY